MNDHTKDALLAYLASFATAHKRDKIAEIIAQRTRHVTVVLEDIYQPHNMSAALRSCEIMGVQDAHLIEERCAAQLNNNIAKGASQWLTISKYSKTQECFSRLKDQGYRIVATTPHTRSYSLENLPIDTKLALVFGTEDSGLSKQALEHADDFVTIPMFGFTQSFNISVSVALCLQDIMQRLRHSSADWKLSAHDARDIQIAWYTHTLPAGEKLIAEFLARNAS
jgi:tRNA (guanosine-2'-O-)-methyltransferase